LEVDDLVYAGDLVLLDDKPLAPRQQHSYIKFNKPRQVTSTLRDPLGKRDLTEYIARMPKGVFPVGRLDRDTTGLLLCTNDGDLANAILHPDHQTDKVYWLWLNEAIELSDPRLGQLLDGVPLRGYLAKAAAVRILSLTACCTELLITLREGKNRQIRRMCRALNFYLYQLHRKSIGPLTVDDVPLGSFRHLTPAEVDALWASTGGRELAEQRKVAALQRRALERRTRGQPDIRLERWLAEPRTR
jgi:pseudouridine synthase